MALNLQVENELGTTAQSVKDQNGNISSLTLSTDTVGIGTPNPQGKLDVSGNIVLNGNAKTQLSATRDSTVLKGSPIILDLSPLGGGQLQIGNNIDDNKIFLEGFSRDGNEHASEMLITGRFAQSLPLFSVLADLVRLLGTVQIGSSLEVNGNILASGDIRLANADCAEEFDICETEQIEPGMVMVLGEDGKLKQSQMAYDKRVAGVISGAGDYKPGIVLDKQQQRGRKPIALLGKVFCKVDAQYGAVEVGDLLTTSPTPGHAMKASDPAKAFGAVIGKALRPLTEGHSLIPILIALQ
jgi:hypothetical protein